MWTKKKNKKLTPCVCGKLPSMYQFGGNDINGGEYWLAQCSNPCCKYRPDSGIQGTHKKAVDGWNKIIGQYKIAIENEKKGVKNG